MRRSAALVAALVISVGALRAQGATGGSVSVIGPVGDPTRDGTPRFAISTTGFLAAEQPIRLQLQVALSADFAPPLWADTTVTASLATIVIPRLLPEGARIWWRVIARTAQNAIVQSNVAGPVRTSRWLALLFPNNRNGSTLDTRQPAFLWTSVAVYPPAQPWSYVITINRSSDGFPVLTASLSDTTFVPPPLLESNTSYRWSVAAKVGTRDSVRVGSDATFVIVDPTVPVSTVLYQNFPNPFPNERIETTCIWFDLRRQSDISLDVLDLRGNRVVRILPGRGLGTTLPPGRYGRAAFGSNSGCDERLAWDGRDQRGRYVPPGAYLIRLHADGGTYQVKTVFRGHP